MRTAIFLFFLCVTEAESFVDLVSAQPTLLRLLPKVGLDLDTSMDFLCIGGALLAFVAMVSRDQRNCIVFAVLWMFYLSMFQARASFPFHICNPLRCTSVVFLPNGN